MDKQQLEQSLQTLADKKASLQQQLADIQEQNPQERVLAAITKQRYFYFKEKPSVIFDRESGYLWAEKWLDVVSGIKSVELTGNNLANTEEVERLIKELKSLDFLGFKGWDIPIQYDFKVILQDNNILPNFIYKNEQTSWVFKGYNYNSLTLLKRDNKLLALHGWYPDSNNISCIKRSAENFDCVCSKIISENETHNNWLVENKCSGQLQNIQFFLVNKSLAIPLPSLDPSFAKFPEAERKKINTDRANQWLMNCLQIFLQHRLLPIFDDHKITPLYDYVLNTIPQLTVELADIETNIYQLLAIKAQQAELLSSQFNYRALLQFKNFDCADIDGSLIRFAHATIEWCELLEEKFAEYSIRQHKLISEGNALTVELAKPYKPDSHLSTAENELLKTRQAFMFERLSLNMNNPIANLASMKIQCYSLKKRLFELNSDANGLVKLGQLAAEPRPSFDLVAENSATMLTDVLKKMEFYEANRELVNALIRIEQDWSKDYKAFKVTAKENLEQACAEDGIDEETWADWLSEWSEKRWLIEQCLQALLEKGLAGAFTQHHIQTTTPLVLQLMDMLKQYKHKLDHFYQHDRKSIHQKFAFQANGALQEKFEAESELYKQTLIFQQTLHDIVFVLEKVEERLWLLQWSKVLINMTIEVILDFIRDKSLDNISKAIINDFSQLKLQNYATFINDAKASTNMINQWDKDYNALLFKMRKELNNNTQDKE